MTFGKRVIALVATAAVASAGFAPVAALADESTDYATAKAEMEQAGSELADYQTSLTMSADELEELKGQISQVQSQIDETQAQYDAAKQKLSGRVHDSYREGSESVLEILLGSQDIDEFVSNLYYVASLNRSDMQALKTAKELSAQLYDQKADLEAKEAAGEEAQQSSAQQVTEYQAKVKEVQAKYNALPDDVKQQLADDAKSAASSGDVDTNDQGVIQDAVLNAVTTVAQADYQDAVSSGDTSSLEDNAAVKAVVETAQTNQSYSGAVSATTGSTMGSSSTSATSGSSSSAGTTAAASTTTTTTSSSSGSSSTSSSSSASGSDWLSRATSVLGTPYVWGGTDTSGFDCSGYVNYVYGSSRGRTTYDMMSSAQSDGSWSTDFDNMQPGDVVITSGGNHVGIYAGDGKMYNSTHPGGGVELSDMSYFDEVGYIPASKY